jgi:PAS domain-containing protein
MSLDLAQFSDIFIDSYFIVNLERTIVDFNRVFHAMLPRSQARNLKTKKCYEVLQLDICKENCIAQQCWKMGRHVRLDEIGGRIIGEEDRPMRFIISAIPIRNDQGEIIGAMEMQRNVTDEAVVQSKYQKQVEASAAQLAQLEEELRLRTRRLLEVGRRFYSAQRAYFKLKTHLFG